VLTRSGKAPESARANDEFTLASVPARGIHSTRSPGPPITPSGSAKQPAPTSPASRLLTDRLLLVLGVCERPSEALDEPVREVSLGDPSAGTYSPSTGVGVASSNFNETAIRGMCGPCVLDERRRKVYQSCESVRYA
jgi:hypothetical protein